MIIKLNEDEKKRLADAVWLMTDIMDKIDGIDEVSGTWAALDEAVAHLKAIEDGVDW